LHENVSLAGFSIGNLFKKLIKSERFGSFI